MCCYNQRLINQIRENQMAIIYAASIDYDGCFTGRGVSDSKTLIEQNTPFSEHLQSRRAALNAKEMVVLCGSTRQSVNMDCDHAGSFGKSNGSAFATLLKFAHSIDARYETALLSDVTSNQDEGYGYQKLKEAIIKHYDGQDFEAEGVDLDKNYGWKLLDEEEILALGWACDEMKRNVVLYQIQKMAFDYQGDEVVFDFYDDRDGDILPILEHFFANDASLIPENVTLNLYHHRSDTQDFTLKKALKGIGPIDQDYKQTTKIVNEMIKRYEIEKLSSKTLAAKGVAAFQVEQATEAKADSPMQGMLQRGALFHIQNEFPDPAQEAFDNIDAEGDYVLEHQDGSSESDEEELSPSV
jgi:hypothetical protein